VLLEPGRDSGKTVELGGIGGWGSWHRVSADSLTFGVGITIVEQYTLVRHGKMLEGTSQWFSDFIMANEPNPPHNRSLIGRSIPCPK
jgi:hypothetical protein